jgi:hypothetical protein
VARDPTKSKPKIKPELQENDPENLSDSQKSLSPKTNNAQNEKTLLLSNSGIKISAQKNISNPKIGVSMESQHRRRSPLDSRENSNLKTKKSEDLKCNFDSGPNDGHMKSTYTFEPHSKEPLDTDTLLDTIQMRKNAKDASPSLERGEPIEMYVPPSGGDAGFYHMKTEGDESRPARMKGIDPAFLRKSGISPLIDMDAGDFEESERDSLDDLKVLCNYEQASNKGIKGDKSKKTKSDRGHLDNDKSKSKSKSKVGPPSKTLINEFKDIIKTSTQKQVISDANQNKALNPKTKLPPPKTTSDNSPLPPSPNPSQDLPPTHHRHPTLPPRDTTTTNPINLPITNPNSLLYRYDSGSQ